MIRLDTINRKIEAVLAAAVATTQPSFVASWSDASSSDYLGSNSVGNLNNTTNVDVVPIPSLGNIRDIDYISLINRDTAPITVTINYNDNGTRTPIVVVTLSPKEVLQYTHAKGWEVCNISGIQIPIFSAYPTGTNQSIVNSTWTKVTLGAKLIDTHGLFNTTNSKFQPNIPGYYQINAVVSSDDSTGVTSTRSAIYKNGLPYLYGDTSGQPALWNGSSTVGDIMYLNGSTDYMELWVVMTGSGLVVRADSSFTRLSGFLVKEG